MIPDLPNLSNPVMQADFMRPYNRDKIPLVDYARGGVALLDGSKGLNVKNWLCELREEDGSCFLSSDGVAPFRIETITGNPSWISLAFDQNMHYNLAYVTEGGAAYLYWYDADAQRYVTTDLGNVITPIIRMDDVRRYTQGTNDIILSYIKNSSLCVRAQADRFLVEYTLATRAGNQIVQCGMNRKLRFQWVCA